MIKKFLLLIILLGMISCKNAINNNAQSSNLRHIVWKPEGGMSMSAIIENVEYIPLEDCEKAIFATATRIMMESDKIFVFDNRGQNALLVFDKSGKFLHRIGHQGRGPKEYIRLTNFTISGDSVYLLDVHAEKILIYHTNGEFIEEQKFSKQLLPKGNWPEGIARLNKGYLFSFNLNPDISIVEDDMYQLIMTDERMTVQKRLFHFKDDDSRYSYASPFQESDSLIVFHQPLCDTVYIFNKNGQCVHSLFFDFGSKKVVDSERDRLDLKEQNCTFIAYTPMLTEKYLMGTVMSDGKLKEFAINLLTDSVYLDTDRKDPGKNIIAPRCTMKDNTIITYISLGFPSREGCKLSDDLEKHLENGGGIVAVYKLK